MRVDIIKVVWHGEPQPHLKGEARVIFPDREGDFFEITPVNSGGERYVLSGSVYIHYRLMPENHTKLEKA